MIRVWQPQRRPKRQVLASGNVADGALWTNYRAFFLLRQQKQPMIEIKPVYATLCWTKTGEQPRTVTERELHDHFHPELVHECILRKLPQIIPKLARRTVNHPVAEQFTGRNSVEKCRN
jgi:hypothetical protein